MIANQDRSGWFGASDTSMVVGNWKTETFRKWWLVKLGLRTNNLQTKAMKCGNAFEHKILDTIPGIRKDHQILIPELRLRVNLDGDLCPTIFEVKTHREDLEFKVSKAYWRQAQVEMFAYGTTDLNILSYPLSPEDYKNYFREVDPVKIQRHPIEYDPCFVGRYLVKLEYLAECMKKGVFPDAKHFTK